MESEDSNESCILLPLALLKACTLYPDFVCSCETIPSSFLPVGHIQLDTADSEREHSAQSYNTASVSGVTQGLSITLTLVVLGYGECCGLLFGYCK